ncbi:hypothetical protein BD770DRAFT_442538 [Pilaira anomala]|nr:hypothetical protein BD770DRAFT_442538 [Pilaira anomala]
MFLFCAVLTSYYSWRHSHIKHHIGLGDMAKDPSNVPLTRSNVGLSPREKDPQADGPHSMFEEMPIVTLLQLTKKTLIVVMASSSSYIRTSPKV